MDDEQANVVYRPQTRIEMQRHIREARIAEDNYILEQFPLRTDHDAVATQASLNEYIDMIVVDQCSVSGCGYCGSGTFRIEYDRMCGFLFGRDYKENERMVRRKRAVHLHLAKMYDPMAPLRPEWLSYMGPSADGDNYNFNYTI